MPRNQRAIIKLNHGDRVEITSQAELEIMILGSQSQRRRRSRRGRRNQQKQNRSCSCQKHEQPQTPEPQSQQQAQSGKNRSQHVPTQTQLPRGQPQPRFETQKWSPRRYAEPVEGLKQRDTDEATRQRIEYRERLERILDVAQVKSSQSELRKSKYVPAQYKREGPNRPQDGSQKPQAQEEQSSRGQSQPQSKPQSQKPPHPPQVQSREPFSFPQSVNAPSSPQKLSDQTLQTLFPWTVGAHVDSPRQQHPQSQLQKKQEKQHQPSSHDTESRKLAPYVVDLCHIPWAFSQLGPGKPPSEPDTDYEQLNFDGSRSPSIVSLNSDSDEGIVIIGNWKATEGDGSWW